MTIEHLASLPLSAPSLLRPDDADSACPASFVDVLEYRVASSPTRVVFRLLGQRALAQYRANHAETGLSAPGTAVDAPPFTPPADQDALSPAR